MRMVSDKHMIQEMCDKAVSKDPSLLEEVRDSWWTKQDLESVNKRRLNARCEIVWTVTFSNSMRTLTSVETGHFKMLVNILQTNNLAAQ